jgi:hypothetical protein
MDATKGNTSTHYGYFNGRNPPISKTDQLFPLVYLVCNGNTRRIQNGALETIKGLCRSDPEYLDMILYDRTLLEAEVIPQVARTKFAHPFAYTYPEGALKLLDMAKQDTFYLNLLNATDFAKRSVCGILIKRAIMDDYTELQESLLRGMPEARLIGFDDTGISIAVPARTEENRLKKQLLQKLGNNPFLEQILNMRTEDATVAHVLAEDDFLGINLIPLIAATPFFTSILCYESKTGVKVASHLISNLEKASAFLGILEKLPVGVCREILEYTVTDLDKNEHRIMAAQLASYQNLAERMMALLTKDKNLEPISLRSVHIDGKETRISDLLIESLGKSYGWSPSAPPNTRPN